MKLHSLPSPPRGPSLSTLVLLCHQGWVSEESSLALEVSDSGGLREGKSGGLRDQIQVCGLESIMYIDQHRGSGVGCPWRVGVQEQWETSWPPFCTPLRLTSNMAKMKDGRYKRDGIQTEVA